MFPKKYERYRIECEAIRRAHHGHITPRMIVTAARPVKHPLHKWFGKLWDAGYAQQKALEDRARELLRVITVVVVSKPKTILAPYYVHDPRAPPNVQRYAALSSGDFSREDARNIILTEIARIEGCVARARGAALELAKRYPGVLGELEDGLAQIVGVARRLSSRHKRNGRKSEGSRLSA